MDLASYEQSDYQAVVKVATPHSISATTTLSKAHQLLILRMYMRSWKDCLRSVRPSLMSLISSRRSGKGSGSLRPSFLLHRTRERSLLISTEHWKRSIAANLNTLPFSKNFLPLRHQLRKSRQKAKWPIIVNYFLATRKTTKERKNCKKYSRNAKASGKILPDNALKTSMTSVINYKQNFVISNLLTCLWSKIFSITAREWTYSSESKML